MWQMLTPEALLSRLSGPEHQALDRAAIDWQQDDALAAIAHEVAEEWRGGLRRVTTVDVRTDAVPSEVLIHILADFRYRAFTRLPGMRQLLDERRVEEWKRALSIRDNLHKISYELPAAEHCPTGEAVKVPLPHMIRVNRGILD
jgi:hypothetical protein